MGLFSSHDGPVMKAFSFASGQSVLPPSVVAELCRDLAEWRDSGLSLLELPFTHADFGDLLAQAQSDLRALLGLSESYRVLFLQGGASAQFGLLPMNLLGSKTGVDYVETGHWSRRAMAAAAAWCDVHVVAQGDGVSLPATWHLSADPAYCHLTTNETAEGLQFHHIPETGDVPLVADMTADFLTRPIPVERFGLIYASAQKNLGVAGLTIVVLNAKLLGRARHGVPAPFNYTLQADAGSRINTPPTFAIAVAAKMLTWLKANGGLESVGAGNARKSAKLYAAIDADGFYQCPVQPQDRSLLNVRFHLPTLHLNTMFLEESEAHGFLHLQGHPSIGGIRVSLYNAVPEEAVDALIVFMDDFRRRRG